jgi:hypothetical protein
VNESQIAHNGWNPSTHSAAGDAPKNAKTASIQRRPLGMALETHLQRPVGDTKVQSVDPQVPRLKIIFIFKVDL